MGRQRRRLDWNDLHRTRSLLLQSRKKMKARAISPSRPLLFFPENGGAGGLPLLASLGLYRAALGSLDREANKMNPVFSSPTTNLLDEALGIGRTGSVPWRIAFVQDCVEASGAFLLHHLLKRSLSAEGAGAVVFLGLAQPFSHYDRVLRKMGCNLSLQRNKNKLHFMDLLDLEFPGGTDQNAIEEGFMNLYSRILRSIEANNLMDNNGGWIRIIIDDISLLEIAAQGSGRHILDFLQYCATLTSELDCSLLILNHGDIYSSEEDQRLLSHLDYLSDVVIKVETLATGIAADVHGQLTIVNKRALGALGWSSNKVYNFQFKVKENGVEFFYPGTKF